MSAPAAARATSERSLPRGRPDRCPRRGPLATRGDGWQGPGMERSSRRGQKGGGLGGTPDEDSPLFGGPDGPPGQLSALGCPECDGVLGVSLAGNGLLEFACRVGHTYSAESLVPLKEDQLERTLWMCVVQFEEVALLHQELATRAEGDGRPEDAAACATRAERAERLAGAVRRIVSEDGPAMPRGGRRERAGA